MDQLTLETFARMQATLEGLSLQINQQYLKIEEQQQKIARLEAQTPQIKEASLEPAPARSGLSTTRRKMLGKLAAAMVAGAAAASVLPGGEAQARVGIDLKADDGSRRIGAIVVPPDVALPTGIPPGASTFKYGLVATDGSDTSFGLASLPIYGTGVFGKGFNYGVWGDGYNGVVGNGTNTGVYGTATGTGSSVTGVSGTGVTGVSGTGSQSGVNGLGTGTGSTGVIGFGTAVGVLGNGNTNGIRGYGSGNNSNGVYGQGTRGVYGNGLYGVYGEGTGYGIYGISSGGASNYAGYFAGNVQITGSMNGATKFFKIDHPLDPANRYLSHATIESAEMLNFYNGIITLDPKGEAVVDLPNWFEALNRDFRYGLTPLGKASPNLFIAEKVSKNSFKIGGGLPGQEVSWQVTGIRQDAYAKAHPIKVEEDKPEGERGRYLHPTLYGQSEDKSVSPKPPSSLANPAPAPASQVVPPTPAAPPTPTLQTKP